VVATQARLETGARVRATAPLRTESERNQVGQKLGRKGLLTRERILAATRELLAADPPQPLTLSAVARAVGLGMTSLYVYFKDLTELVLAVLEPVMASSEDAYVRLVRQRWNDDALGECTLVFVHAFHGFWRDNSRLLHLRNTLADAHDHRMSEHRIQMARGVINLLGRQMDAPASRDTGPEFDLASVLYTGLERVVTIATDTELQATFPPTIRPRFRGATLEQQARVLALAIADERRTSLARR
jgi:AcrR family transcriptional regulator